MSTAYSSPYNLPDQDVLGELLHSLSQPLTSLRCSLELTFDESAEQQQAAVGIALQQTERVIAMIQLMRDYLDAEQSGVGAHRSSLDRVLRGVVGDATSVAEVRGVELQVEGACSANVALAEPRLRLALQYLTLALIEKAPPGGRVLLRMEEGSTESALLAHILGEDNAPARPQKPIAVHETLRMVKLAIARRVLEAGGTLLALDEGERLGFLLRIPRMLAASRAVV